MYIGTRLLFKQLLIKSTAISALFNLYLFFPSCIIIYLLFTFNLLINKLNVNNKSLIRQLEKFNYKLNKAEIAVDVITNIYIYIYKYLLICTEHH